MNQIAKDSNKKTGHFKVFVSMPYDADDEPKKFWAFFYKKAIEPLKEILERETDFHFDFLYKKKDKKPGDIPTLVAESLDEADILLCVLTNFKPNVMYEIGYARKMGIPIVFVLDQCFQKEPIPILIGRPQTLYYDGLNEDSFETIPNELWQFLKGACWEAQGKRNKLEDICSPIYMTRCYQNRDYLNIPQLIKDAKCEIEILTTNVDYFVALPDETVQHTFKIQDFKDAIGRGVKIHIWTMDPDSNIVVERSKLLQPIMRADVFQYRKALLKNIKTLYIYFQSEIKEGKFFIGIYEALPTLMIYRIDDRYFIPSVSLIKRSRLCTHVEFKGNDPGVKDTFETTLDEIRRIARPVEQYSWIREDWPTPYEIKDK